MRGAKTLNSQGHWEPGLDKLMPGGQMDLKMPSYPQGLPEAEKEVHWEMAKTPRHLTSEKQSNPGGIRKLQTPQNPSSHSSPLCLPVFLHTQLQCFLKHLSFSCVAFPEEV